MKRITKISKASLISFPKRTAPDSLSAQIISLFFLVLLPFDFRSGIDRVGTTAHDLLPLHHKKLAFYMIRSNLVGQITRSTS